MMMFLTNLAAIYKSGQMESYFTNLDFPSLATFGGEVV